MSRFLDLVLTMDVVKCNSFPLGVESKSSDTTQKFSWKHVCRAELLSEEVKFFFLKLKSQETLDW